ncbi:MAG: hypothetical protein WC843_05430 [Candidatus Gracilibacteria bacterium]|jgi:hypothetical protein
MSVEGGFPNIAEGLRNSGDRFLRIVEAFKAFEFESKTGGKLPCGQQISVIQKEASCTRIVISLLEGAKLEFYYVAGSMLSVSFEGRRMLLGTLDSGEENWNWSFGAAMATLKDFEVVLSFLEREKLILENRLKKQQDGLVSQTLEDLGAAVRKRVL